MFRARHLRVKRTSSRAQHVKGRGKLAQKYDESSPPSQRETHLESWRKLTNCQRLLGYICMFEGDVFFLDASNEGNEIRKKKSSTVCTMNLLHKPCSARSRCHISATFHTPTHKLPLRDHRRSLDTQEINRRSAVYAIWGAQNISSPNKKRSWFELTAPVSVHSRQAIEWR